MSERRISGKQELSTGKIRNDIGLFHETLNTISKKGRYDCVTDIE